MRGILLALLALGLVAVASPATADTSHEYNCGAGPSAAVNCVTHCATHALADLVNVTPGIPPCLLHP